MYHLITMMKINLLVLSKKTVNLAQKTAGSRNEKIYAGTTKIHRKSTKENAAKKCKWNKIQQSSVIHDKRGGHLPRFFRINLLLHTVPKTCFCFRYFPLSSRRSVPFKLLSYFLQHNRFCQCEEKRKGRICVFCIRYNISNWARYFTECKG